MKTRTAHNTQRNPKRGSALTMVMILAGVLFIWIGSIMMIGRTESRINKSHEIRQQAQLAAESIAEYGFAELVRRFKSQTSLQGDDLETDPLVLPTSFSSFFLGSGLIADECELFGGQIPSLKKVYINPQDPANVDDDHIGKMVDVREVNIYAKAVIINPFTETKVYAYVLEKLQVRDSPLFSNAIFYNMDLELHPGPAMNIKGPVHTNGNAWLQAIDGITFWDSVTATGNIYHGYKQSNSITQTGNVYIKDLSGKNQNMKNSNGSWLDANDPTWQSKAQQRWDGLVQDFSHGVPNINPIGITDYEPNDPFTTASELENHAYAVIEPVLAEDHPDYKGDTIRQEQYAYKAGIKFKIDDFDGNGTLEIKAFKYERINPSDPKSDPVIDSTTKLPKEIEVFLPDGLIGNGNAAMTAVDGNKEPEAYSFNSSTSKVTGGMYDHRQNVALNMVSFDMEMLRYMVDDTYNASNIPSGQGNGYGDNTAITAEELKTKRWTDPTGSLASFDPVKDWNGVVYVQIPTWAKSADDTSSAKRLTGGQRADKVVSAKLTNLGINMINASSIPYPEYTKEAGVTIATNAPLYMVGNFNADGSSSTGSSTAIESRTAYKSRSGTTRTEPPASIASDTLTILSNRWNTLISSKGPNRDYSDESSTSKRTGVFTEISAAILTGLKPTIPDAAAGGTSSWISGGAHNFPRFLENWSSTLTIRGSLVALFESEVHESAMPTDFSHYYSPPTRDWGFNDNFLNGFYPPGTPNTRTYPRVAFKSITKEQYDEAISNLY
jgi:hypothetical protein